MNFHSLRRTVDYRGEKNGYHLEPGDRADLVVDPEGDLPTKLAKTVDSAQDIALLVFGGVLLVGCFAFGLVWPLVRRALS